MFILVKVAPGAGVRQVRLDLLHHVKDVEVFTTAQFSRMTTFYWMFTTGAGVAVLIAAVLGIGGALLLLVTSWRPASKVRQS